MSPDFHLIIALIGAIPGFLALLGAAVGYGRIVQRLSRVEQDVADMKRMGETVARIDERTKGTDQNVQNLRQAVDRFVEIIVGERQAFAEPTRPRER